MRRVAGLAPTNLSSRKISAPIGVGGHLSDFKPVTICMLAPVLIMEARDGNFEFAEATAFSFGLDPADRNGEELPGGLRH
jgi:hypothetical protein